MKKVRVVSFDPQWRRRRRWVGVAIVILLVAVAMVVVRQRLAVDDRAIAGEAVVTASSIASGFTARDAVSSGSVDAPGAAWQSENETIGAWIELTWPEVHVLRQVVLVRNPLDEPGVTDGFLSFGDGSFVQLTLSRGVRQTVVPITPRSVDRLRFTAVGVSPGARHVSIGEIVVGARSSGEDVVADPAAGGNSAPSATVTASPGTSDPAALTDGSGTPGAAGGGSAWTVDRPAGAWAQLDWDEPRELAAVELVGSSRSAAALGAVLTFDDGASLPVGAVLGDPTRPTILAFMPRVTRSLRLTFDEVGGEGPVALDELRAYQRGATPERPPSAAGTPQLNQADVTCSPPPAGSAGAGLVVRCPRTGTTVDQTVDFQVSAPGYTSVSATVWPADGSAPGGAPVRAVPDASGMATPAVDVAAVPPGPFTVVFEATGPGREKGTVRFQLYRSGTDTGGDVASDGPVGGRTLAYAEEFDRPVSVSRTGAGADYAAAKPTAGGAEDFGDAVFSSPGSDTVQVVDNRYLRISVEPTPTGFTDPNGWSRTHLGGLLASARQGGSGFSAQYGYFEARMLVPAAPGTWPAFWMLPNDSLSTPGPVGSEVDAVELYGHDPKSACHTTHQYLDGKNTGGIAECGQRFATERDAMAWHTYGVSITPTGVLYYIDGRVVAAAPQVRGGDAPMFFLVDLALGGGWPVQLRGVQDRAAMYVDYVRVYV